MNRGAWSSETKIVFLLLITYSDKEIVVVIVLKEIVFTTDFYFNFEILVVMMMMSRALAFPRNIWWAFRTDLDFDQDKVLIDGDEQNEQK